MNFWAVAFLLLLCLTSIVVGVAMIHVASAFIVGGVLGIVYTVALADLDRRHAKEDK